MLGLPTNIEQKQSEEHSEHGISLLRIHFKKLPREDRPMRLELTGGHDVEAQTAQGKNRKTLLVVSDLCFVLIMDA